MLERRVHYRRQNHYRTKSNKYKIVKTPGKLKLVVEHEHDCLCRWQVDNSLLEEKGWSQHARHPQAQISCSPQSHRYQAHCLQTLRRQALSRRRQGQVCTHSFPSFFFRIVRAFLIEEVKQMKRLMQQKDKSSKKSKKNKSKKQQKK